MPPEFWEHLAEILLAVGVLLNIAIGVWNKRAIDRVHDSTNGLSHELNKLTGQAEHAKGKVEGKAEGKAEEKDEQAARDTIAGLSNRGT